MAVVVDPQHSNSSCQDISTCTINVSVFAANKFGTHKGRCRMSRREGIAPAIVGTRLPDAVFRSVHHCGHDDARCGSNSQSLAERMTGLDADESEPEMSGNRNVLNVVVGLETLVATIVLEALSDVLFHRTEPAVSHADGADGNQGGRRNQLHRSELLRAEAVGS